MDQLNVLLQTVLVETDYKLAVGCFLDLAAVYPAQQISELLRVHVADQTFIVRLRAVQFIGLLSLTDQDLMETLKMASRDRSWVIREAAIVSIVRLAKVADVPALDAECRQALVDRALNDVHATIRELCIEELSHLRGPHDVSEVVFALQSGSPAVQIRALRVCEGVGAFALGALSEIEQLLESSHAKRRLRAVAACRSCLNRKTILLLIRRLYDGDQRVRSLSREILVRAVHVVEHNQQRTLEIVLRHDTALQSIDELLHLEHLTDEIISDFKELRSRRLTWRSSLHESDQESGGKWHDKEAVWQLVYLVDKIVGPTERMYSVAPGALSATFSS